MGFRITKVMLTSLSGVRYKSRDEDAFISVGQINIFIGPNNSGKSRLLRSILFDTWNAKASIWFHGDNYSFIKLNKMLSNPSLINAIDRLNSNLNELYKKRDKVEVRRITFISKELIENWNDRRKSFQQGFNYTQEFDLLKLEKITEELARKKFSQRSIPTNGLSGAISKAMITNKDWHDRLIEEEHRIKSLLQTNSLYIPILRTLRPLIDSRESVTVFNLDLRRYDETDLFTIENNDKLNKNLLKRRVVFEYFSIDSDSVFRSRINSFCANNSIFTGYEFFNELKRLLLGNKAERNKVRAYEEFLSKNLFDGQEITLIPSETEGVVTITIGDEDDLAVYKLGDGIQTIILVTFKPFTMGEGVFFIEEPDLMLHPGMQRKLIEVLAKLEDCQFFITTHSNHLLDLAADYDAKIFSVKKSRDDNGDIAHIVESLDPGDIRALRLLGVRHSSSFLVNATIWVEGITERLYLRQYLDLYQRYASDQDESFKVYREDVHYSFVEYAGSNITHLNVLDEEEGINVDRLCARMFLIADNDGCDMSRVEGEGEPEKDWSSKEKRLWKLYQKLGERFFALDVREVENMLTPHVINYVVYCWKKANREKLGEGAEPETVFSAAQDDYRDKYLGTFIQEAIDDDYGTFASKSGTIAKKVDFAQLALKRIRSWEDMSPDAQKLAERIYAFIKKQNES